MSWRLREERNRDGRAFVVTTELPCINGLSAHFTIARVYEDEAAHGYSDGAFDAERIARQIAATPDMEEALSQLVRLIDAAGIHNLSNGVQLGQVSWAVKMSGAMDFAKEVLAKAAGAPHVG